MKIEKITIKQNMGAATVDESYEDKIKLTNHSISYEYQPHPASQLETNIYRKWSYKTTSPIYRQLYDQVEEMVLNYVRNQEKPVENQAEPIRITVKYENGYKERAFYYVSHDYFKDMFACIKQMVPGCEYTPALLLTEE